MPKDKDDLTRAERDPDDRKGLHTSRRRWLAMSGGTLFAGALGASTAAADSTEHPNRITFDGGEDWVKSTYEFRVSGSVAEFDDGATVEWNDSMGEESASGTVHRNVDTYRFSGSLMHIDIDGPATVSVEYGDDPDPDASRLEIVASDKSAIEYEFTTTERAARVTTNGSNATDVSDSVSQNNDGSWTVTGDTAYGRGDTWDFRGDVTDFAPMEGEFTLFLDGEEITPHELTSAEALTEDRKHSYSFEGTGSEYADYYLEVEEGGNMIASTVDGAVIEEELHWISDDGTKAAGRVDPGERHAYEFDTLVLDVTIDGQADAYVNGSPSNVDRYPQPGATGDSWKGGFPWQNEDDGNDEPTGDREHSYSFEGSGSEPADYFLEVEDGGNMIASTVDGAVIEEEFHWISDDGTKAAGQVDPGERHAYEFDTLVLDVTIDGSADAYVNGSPSNVDRYPQPGATGDGWKSGFPWQDDDEGTNTDPPSDEPVGGGAGYGDILTESDADVVVSTVSELESELSSATSGDVIFVDGDAELDVTNMHVDMAAGVTLASGRGRDGSGGATLYNTSITEHNIRAYGGRITGLDVRGAYPGDDTTSDWGDRGIATYGPVEIDNCEVRGFSTAAIQCRGHDGGSAHVHHCFIHNNNGNSRGYGVAVLGNSGRDGGVPRVNHCFFENDRHSVTTDGGPGTGFISEYNHFSPTTWRWPSDAHQSGENDGYASDVIVIRNCIFEATRERFGGGSDVQAHAARGPARESADVYQNWFFHNSDGEAISYSGGAEGSYSVYDNHYGEDATVDYADVIPGYNGFRT